MQYEDVMACQHVSPIRSSPKEKLLPNIDGVCIVGVKIALILWLALNDMTYSNVVSVHAKKYRHI
jgi:hypothetical protein